jgi:hypothetical protein
MYVRRSTVSTFLFVEFVLEQSRLLLLYNDETRWKVTYMDIHA